jgi:polar amino acid transport system substrate-binding protein
LVSKAALSVEDLPGRVVAVALGSDGDAWLRHAQQRVAGIETARFDAAADALQAVRRGRADAAIVEGLTARQMLSTQFNDLSIAAQLTGEPYVIAVWGESVELLAAIDQSLAEMEADGTLEKIVEEWMHK